MLSKGLNIVCLHISTILPRLSGQIQGNVINLQQNIISKGIHCLIMVEGFSFCSEISVSLLSLGKKKNPPHNKTIQLLSPQAVV